MSNEIQRPAGTVRGRVAGLTVQAAIHWEDAEGNVIGATTVQLPPVFSPYGDSVEKHLLRLRDAVNAGLAE